MFASESGRCECRCSTVSRPSILRRERRQCSGCGPSSRNSLLTLTDVQRPSCPASDNGLSDRLLAVSVSTSADGHRQHPLQNGLARPQTVRTPFVAATRTTAGVNRSQMAKPWSRRPSVKSSDARVVEGHSIHQCILKQPLRVANRQVLTAVIRVMDHARRWAA
jgi:hypothetical protein